MTNLERVQAFIGAWEAIDLEAIMAMLAPDAVYHNIPMPVMRGHDEIRGFVAPFLATTKEVRWTVHHIAQSAGGTVLTERTDVFVTTDGKRIAVRVMGAFEFADGLISAWRDYFDLAEFTSQLG